MSFVWRKNSQKRASNCMLACRVGVGPLDLCVGNVYFLCVGRQSNKGVIYFGSDNREKEGSITMTDFEKVKGYYSVFDEKNRLTQDNSGRMEYEMTMRIFEKYLPDRGRVLDIGGGAGVYAFPLAKSGYQVYLGDLSERLVEQAREQKKAENVENMISIDVVNATNMERYQDAFFDVVIVLGPFYHLTEEKEREACVSEIRRVLKPGGMVIAGFIPRLAGSIAVVDRYCWDSEQVGAHTIGEVFSTGRFHNMAARGFQEGYYATAIEMEEMFEAYHFKQECIRSIRGFGYEKEDKIYAIRDEAVFAEVMKCIEETAQDKAIVEMCGHAVYIGRKGEA